jgi:hypothetical protein
VNPAPVARVRPEEGFVDVGSAFPADAEAFEAVESGEHMFDDARVGSQGGAVPGSASGDGRDDAAGAGLGGVLWTMAVAP